MKSRMFEKALRMGLGLLLLVAFAGMAQAANFAAKASNNQILSASSYYDSTGAVAAAMPTASDDVYITCGPDGTQNWAGGITLGTGDNLRNNGNDTFPGRAIYARQAAGDGTYATYQNLQGIIFGKVSRTLTINDLRLNNSAVTTNNSTGNNTIAGNITFTNSGMLRARGAGQYLTVNAILKGDVSVGGLTFSGVASDPPLAFDPTTVGTHPAGTTYIVLNGVNTVTGFATQLGGGLTLNNASALGGLTKLTVTGSSVQNAVLQTGTGININMPSLDLKLGPYSQVSNNNTITVKTLVVNGNAVAPNTYTMTALNTTYPGFFTGTGSIVVSQTVPPTMQLSTNAIAYNTVRTVRGTHFDSTVTLTNAGGSDLTFTGSGPNQGLVLSNTADYSLVNVTPSTASPLAPGQSVKACIRFNPSGTTTRQSVTGTLTVNTSDAANPAQVVNLSGKQIAENKAILMIDGDASDAVNKGNAALATLLTSWYGGASNVRVEVLQGSAVNPYLNVQNFTPAAQAFKKIDLEAYDLVFLGRNINSGNVGSGTAPDFWNNLNTALVTFSPSHVNNGRLKWFASGDTASLTHPLLTVQAGSDLANSGIPVDASGKLALYDPAGYAPTGGSNGDSTSITLYNSGKIIATVPANDTDAVNAGHFKMMRWAASSAPFFYKDQTTSSPYHPVAARGAASICDDNSNDYISSMTLTGKALLKNFFYSILTPAVPKWSTTADAITFNTVAVQADGNVPTTAALGITNWTPTALNFLGSGTPKGLTLSNTTDFTILGVTTSTASALGQGKSTIVTLRFNPAGATNRLNITGNLTIATDSSTSGTRIIPLKGDLKMFSEIAVSATNLHFGSVNVITHPIHPIATTATLAISNLGGGPLVFTPVSGNAHDGLSFTGAHAADYSVLSLTKETSLTLAPDETTTLTIKFLPTEAVETANMGATLVIKTNDLSRPTVNVTLTGDAVPVELSTFKAE